MKFPLLSLLPIVCTLSFTGLRAEASFLEDTPLSLPTRGAVHEELQLDNALQTAEEELTLLEESIPEVNSEPNSFAIDLAKPLDDVEIPLSLEVVEEASYAPVVIVPQVKEEQPIIEQPTYTSIAASDAVESPSATLTIQSESTEIKPNLDIEVDLTRAFAGAPFIYSLLIGMSIFSVFIWLYSLLSLKKMSSTPSIFLRGLSDHLNSNNFEAALSLCGTEDTLLSKMLSSGIQSRKYGLAAMIESMKAEGKRSSINFWQKIGFLNDIAVLAPMLGLLGTVLGMFYAFYDVNRSIESITTLFDGLGISIGTTVAGLMVAILALILHSTAKYRLVKVLAEVESEAYSVAALMDSHLSFHSSGSK